MIEQRYLPDGVALERFLLSRARVNVLQGPWGAGKSTACCYKLAMNALNQPPGPDGVRRRRSYVIRNTFDQLRRTTLKTWERVFDERLFGPIRRTAPFEHRIRLGDLDWEVTFLALEDAGDRRKLLSAEISDAWFNEMREIERGLIDDADGRIGRFPSIADGGCAHPMLIGDTNAPPEDHWIAVMSGQAPMPENADDDERAHLARPQGWRFFIQPAAMVEVRNGQGEVASYAPNPRAENVRWLPAGYYDKLVLGKPPSWVRVNVLNRPGRLQHGKPVWPEYREDLHAALTRLEPAPGHPILVGVDFGRTPAAVIGQRVFDRWLILAELVAEDMGARAFARLLKRTLAKAFPGFAVQLWGDPAGEHLAEADDISPFLMFRAEGLRIFPAPTNDPSVRIGAVKEALCQLVDGQLRFRISPACPVLRAALAGGYRYRRLQVVGERYDAAPEKDRFSHVADALQYLMLGAGEGRALLSGERRARGAVVAPQPKSVFQRHGREPRP